MQLFALKQNLNVWLTLTQKTFMCCTN